MHTCPDGGNNRGFKVSQQGRFLAALLDIENLVCLGGPMQLKTGGDNRTARNKKRKD